jgi:hypothetical protein
MKRIKNISAFVFLVLLATACITDKDELYSFDYITAPAKVSAVFDITQDNTGLVSILPNAEGAHKFKINFGDGSAETEINAGKAANHNYSEGKFVVTITAIGITKLESKYSTEITVSYKAPENLQVKIEKNTVNPKIVSVSATADFATVFSVYFGDVENEVPVNVLPDEVASHTYVNPGDYQIRVVAKGAATATTEYKETVTITAASDPVNLPINFESFVVNYAFTDFGNVTSSVLDNPDKTGINPSARVAKSVKNAGAETWAGTFLTLENPIDFSAYKTFKVKVWSPKSGAVVKLKVENLTDGSINLEVDAVTSVSNQWEELTFDFGAIDVSKQYQKVVIFFDFGKVGDGSTYYFDDIKQVPSSVPSTLMVQNFEGAVPQFTSFGNIAGIEVVANPNASGANTTGKTAKLTKSSGSEVWAGAFFEVASPLDFDSYSKVNIKTWSPKSGIVVKLKLENANASITHEVDVTNTVANGWETLTYDFSGAPAADYVRIVIFFDFGKSGDGSVYYFDEIELANDGSSETPAQGFQDFEGDVPKFTVFGNIAATEVIANPDATGANKTAHVAKLTKSSGAETWAGTFFEQKTALDLTTFSKINVKTWSPKSGVVVKLKLENADASITHEVDVNTSVANAWETLTYNFSAAPAASYVRVVIFFDFGKSGDGSVYYFDEFELTN